jgi:putative oxidoreductase
MKRILSVSYSSAAFNLSMLLLRAGFGLLIIIRHGLPKLQNFSTMQSQFYNFMGLGSQFSVALVIFAELICGFFILLGLFTRLAVIPLIIELLVVIFAHDAGKPLAESEMAIMYLASFLVLLFCGPGRISVDGMINR